MSEPSVALPRELQPGEATFSLRERAGYLKRFGRTSQAFTAMQPGMQYFDMPGIGYIAYMRKWGGTYVLSDPVTAPEHFPLILEQFQQTFPRTCYMQVSRSVVDFLHQNYGMYGTQFGSAPRVNLRGWSLKGKKKQVLRTALNQAEKQGIEVREQFTEQNAREISDAWLATRKRKTRQIGFMIRPMEMDYHENERHFFAYQDGKAVGFVWFDPIYEDNRIISYVPNISRASEHFRQGIFYTIMVHAMEVFRNEGVPYMDLGLSPLQLDPRDEPQESPRLKRLLQLIYEKGNFLYSFKGMAFTKSRFRGQYEKFYCAHRSPIPMLDFLAIVKLTRLL